MAGQILAGLWREIRLLAVDPWLASLVSWLPPVLFCSLWLIFSGGIARDLAIGVVDLDHSRMSRSLTRQYDTSPTLAVERGFNSVAEGANALRGGGIYALVVLPESLEKNVLTGRSPQVTVFYNSQFILIGRLVNNALLQAHGTSVAGIETVASLFSGGPRTSELAAVAVPIGSQLNPLFNSGGNYAQFLVSAIIPAIWQILIVVTTVLTLAAEIRRGGLPNWLKIGPVSALILKLTPCTLLFWLQGLLFLWGMFGLLGWPMHGSWTVLALAQLLTVLACQAAGACIFFLSLDPTRSLSLAAAYAAPAFAFMGITFPVTDMSTLARVWRSLLPISHYIDIQVGQANYGVSISAAIPEMGYLLIFLLLFSIVVLRAYRIAATEPAIEVMV